MGRTGNVKSWMIGIVSFVVGLVALVVAFRATVIHKELMPQALIKLSKIEGEKRQQIINFLLREREKIQTLAVLPLWSSQTSATWNSSLQVEEKAESFKNIFFFSPTGALLFSASPLKRETALPSTALTQSLSRTMMSLSADFSTLAYEPMLASYACFITHPVFFEKQLLGIIVAQIDETKVYPILSNYNGLGETGDVDLFAKIDESAWTIAPTRFDKEAAFQSALPLRDEKYPWARALSGNAGIETSVSVDHVPIGSAWDYVPMVGWGLLVSQDIKEIQAPLLVYQIQIWAGLSVMIVAWSAAIFFIIHSHAKWWGYVVHWMAVWGAPSPARRSALFLVLSLSSFVYLSFQIFDFYNSNAAAFARVSLREKTEIEDVVQQINADLYRLQSMGSISADDMSSGRLSKDNVNVRFTRDLTETPLAMAMAAVYFSQQEITGESLYGEIYAKENKEIKALEIKTAYGSSYKQTPLVETRTGNMRSGWLQPYFDPFFKKIVAVYFSSFYAPGQVTEPIGMIVVYYDIERLRAVTEHIGVDTNSYTWIAYKDGTLIYYPIEEYVMEQRTLQQLNREFQSETFVSLATSVFKNEQGVGRFKSERTGSSYWMYYQKISVPNWVIGQITNRAQVILPPDLLRQFVMRIILATCIFLAMIGLIIFRLPYYTIAKLWGWSLSFSVVTGIGILLLWDATLRTNAESVSLKQPLTDQVGISNSLNEWRQLYARKNIPFASVIPTGIIINNIGFEKADMVVISGFLWQKWPKAVPIQPITFPKALEVNIQAAYRENTDEEEIVGYQFFAKFPLTFNWKKYPLDVTRLSLELSPLERGDPLLFVPDLASYAQMRPQDLPGLTPNLAIAGYKVSSSFFALEPTLPKTTDGLSRQLLGVEQPLFSFNVVLTREILNSFITYLLPLGIAIIALFVSFWFAIHERRGESGQEERRSMFGICVGLAFAIILVHGGIRFVNPAGEILYIEFFFFSSYVTMILLMCYMLVVGSKGAFGKWINARAPIALALFWPLQFATWFMMTYIPFYH